MDNRTTKLKKFFLSSCLTGIILISLPLQQALAATSRQDDLQDDIVSATRQMESIMERSYENAKEDVESIIDAEGYNYELTMASFHEQKKPYADFNYRQFIAAYATIQEYCAEKHLTMGNGINDVKFLYATVRAATLTEKIPEEVGIFIDNGDGTFRRSGRKYILDDTSVPDYTEREDGVFIPAGTRNVTLKEKTTRYGEVLLQTVSVEELCRVFGVDISLIEGKIQDRYEKINQRLEDRVQLNQSTFICMPTGPGAEELSFVSESIASGMNSTMVNNILLTAQMLIGQVPYEWGGKASSPGFDKTWWTFDESGQQKGLDCSGFVQWTFMTAGMPMDICSDMYSTHAILRSNRMQRIDVGELKPGDLGLLFEASTDASPRINHVGIYVGNDKWIHCSSSRGTVAVTNNPGFTTFRRPMIDHYVLEAPIEERVIEDVDDTDENGTEPKQSDAIDIYIEEDAQEPLDLTKMMPTPYVDDPSEESLDYLARIVQAEAGNQGFNGWVAVAEVVMNRVRSPRFAYADDVFEVISAPGQFAAFERAMEYDEPDQQIKEVCRQVMLGKIGILNNPDCLYFQNPDKSGYGYDEFNGARAYMRIGGHTFYLVDDMAPFSENRSY